MHHSNVHHMVADSEHRAMVRDIERLAPIYRVAHDEQHRKSRWRRRGPTARPPAGPTGHTTAR